MNTPPQAPSDDSQLAHTYPADAIVANAARLDVIPVEQAGNLAELFQQRVQRSPHKIAYLQYDAVSHTWREYTWQQTADQVQAWRAALAVEALAPGARVAIRLSNRLEWVLGDQAILASGAVVVPIYVDDRRDNVAYILEHTETEVLFVERLAQWQEMQPVQDTLSRLKRVVVVDAADAAATQRAATDDHRVRALVEWLSAADSSAHQTGEQQIDGDSLATIVYTSGTTGRPKGVMLSHNNILHTAYGGLQSVAVFPEDRFLSFLPLSHTFERTVGYYLTVMAGASNAFNRSIDQLLDDLALIKPTALITVPRIFERAYARIQTQLQQGPAFRRALFNQAVKVGYRRFEITQARAAWSSEQLLWPLLKPLVANKVAARFGGRLRLVICGGAPLATNIAHTFIGLGIDILQGYGLTETSPVLSVNTLAQNKPASIGQPLRSARLRLGQNSELEASGPSIMQGYWRDTAATAAVMDADGWLKTGDIARIDADGFIYITGRIKEIIVLANGEKVPPANIEAAICDDPLFEQAMVVGEGRAFLSALLVLNDDSWPQFARAQDWPPDDPATLQRADVQAALLQRVAQRLEGFPGYAVVHKICPTRAVWSVQDGALTPTLKVKRAVLQQRFAAQIDAMYAGH